MRAVALASTKLTAAESAVALDAGTLDGLSRIASELGAHSLAAEARALAERAAEGRFYVACLGQFKRGKSTLINALIEHAALPTGVIPVTSVPTIIRYGERLGARVRVRGSGWCEIDPTRLGEFVSEEENPENAKGVEAVELFAPSAQLVSGLCLVDTPGIGSVFAGNSAATREFVPHVDAALVVIGADPPLTGEELALVDQVARTVRHFTFVLNKADRVSEADLEQAVGFSSRIITNRLGQRAAGMLAGRILVVSALEQLQGVRHRPDWDALVAGLRELAERSGRALVRDAVRRGVARVRDRLLAIVHEEIAVLTRPLNESEARLRRLTERTEAAERALVDLGPLLSAEQSRLMRTFGDRRTAFLGDAAPVAARLLSERLRVAIGPNQAGSRSRTLAIAQEVARATVEPWLSESERAADEAYRAVAARFVGLTNQLLRDLRDADAYAQSVLPEDIAPEEHLRTERRFHFHEFQHLAAPAGLGPLLRRAIDGILPPRVRARRIESAAQSFLLRLLEVNTSRVEGGLGERVLESRRLLESEIRRVLAEVRALASNALSCASDAHLRGRDAVAAAVAERERVRATLMSIRPTEGAEPSWTLGDPRIARARPASPSGPAAP